MISPPAIEIVDTTRVKPSFALAVLLLATGQASAEQARVRGVVELFTSQGCNSCPQADANLAELVHHKDLVALAYHVDYWDYRGWHDTLATPENTERQRDYVKALKSKSFYTPQAVINGQIEVNGSDKRALEARLSEQGGLPVGVSIRKDNDVLVIDVEGGDGPKQNAHILLVTYDAARPVSIDRGENAGHTLVYWNAVRDVQTTGMWHGQPVRFEIPLSEISKKGTGGSAVLVQSMTDKNKPGPILGAATLALDAHHTP